MTLFAAIPPPNVTPEGAVELPTFSAPPTVPPAMESAPIVLRAAFAPVVTRPRFIGPAMLVAARLVPA